MSSTETAKLSLSAPSATVKDVFQVTKIVTDAADGSSDGKVTIDISGTPVYIEIAQKSAYLKRPITFRQVM